METYGQVTLFGDVVMDVVKNSDVFKHEREWVNFTDSEMSDYIETVFNYYRNERGFPHFTYDKGKNISRFKKICDINTLSLIDGKNIKQTMHGLDIAWSYHPHVWGIRQGECLTPEEVFYDDDMLRGAIKKRIALGDEISDNMIRKVLCIYKNAKRVSNFRPTAASAIYNYLGGGVVYDMSCGFGGRLLGAMSNRNVKKYYGVEPATETYDGLLKMKADLGDHFLGDAHIVNTGSEDYIPPEDIDIAFTSPPYFDTEKYTDEPTQSYIKFPDYGLWLNGFLGQTMRNCYQVLRVGGYMAINIANTTYHKTLEADTVKMAKGVGFKYEDTLQLLLSRVSKKTGFKSEPVFIFTKRGGEPNSV